ncbi:MAG: hypothetical protein IK144_03875 [Bacteroidaceae bacterium]|nr:hypothetical protein [Bacteroidaceae bacterium]
MKKKLIQILMLAIVTVSIGSFVSCKDTNEDLYNELRNEMGDKNASLQQRYNDLLQQMQAEHDYFQGLYDAINSCTCSQPGGLKDQLTALINNLQQQIDAINGQLTDGNGNSILGDLSTLIDPSAGINTITDYLNSLQNQINILTTNYNTLASVPADLAALQNTLTTEIANLQSQIDELKNNQGNYADLLDRIVALETKMATAEANIQAALGRLDNVETAVTAATNLAQAASDAAANAAQVAANAAQAAANAQADATEAKQNAADALQKALDAINAAAALQTLVDTNTANITALQTAVQTIQTTLTQYGTQISDNTAAIQKNAQDIATNVANIQKNADDIAELKTKINNMQTELTTVSQKATDAFNKANDAYAKATTNEAAISALNDRVTTNETDIQNLKTSLQTLQTTVNNLTTQVNTNTTDIENLKTSVNNLNTTVNNLNTTVSELSTKVSELSTKLDTMEAEITQIKADCAANLEAAKAYTDQEVATLKTELLAEIANQLAKYYTKEEIDAKFGNYYTKDEIDAQQNAQDIKINANTAKIGELETTVDEHTSAIEAINAALAAIKSCTCDPAVIEDILNRLTEAEKNIGDNADAIAANTALINSVKDELTELINNQIEAVKTELEGKINDVDGKVDALQLVVSNLNYITPEEVESLVNALQDQVAAELAALNQTDEDFKKRMDIIGDSVKTAFADIVDLKTRVQVLESTTVKIEDYELDKAAIYSRIDANDAKISDLETRATTLEGQVATLQEDLGKLNTRMDAAEERLDKAEAAIEGLKNDVAALQDYLSKMVTGITIQGALNPWFGAINTPFDIQSNILITFYGRPKSDIEFPTMKTANYVRAREALTEKDMEMINGVEIFEKAANTTLLYENGYAGKIYMTINPNTADVTGLQPLIVNTKDVVSPFTIEPIKPCTEGALQFGWTSPTRAQSSNGLYMAKVGIKPVDVPRISEPSFQSETMVDAIKNAKQALTTLAETHSTSGTASNLTKIASDILSIVKDLSFDRSGLKVSYTTTDASGKETTHSVYSEYNLAATGFQPLSLETLKDLNVITIPGYERASNLLDRLAAKLKSKVSLVFDKINNSSLVNSIVNLEIKEVELKDLSDELIAKFEITIGDDVTIDGLTYHMQIPANSVVPVKLVKDLTVNGKSVNIPNELFIDPDNPNVTGPTLVVVGDVTTAKVTMKLVVPVTNDSMEKYVWFDIEDDQIQRSLDAGNVLTIEDKNIVKFTETAGSYNVTTLSTPNINLKNMIDLSSDTTPTLKLEFTYDLRNEMLEIWGYSQDAISSVNDMLEDIRDIITEANNALDKINSYEGKMNGTIDSYVDRLQGYLDKINSVATRALNTTNYRFQPFMVASDSKGLKRLSTAKNYPTWLQKTGTYLYPTSQTLELFVPLARKHVAVTNVFTADLSKSAQSGDADCIARLQAANAEKMNTVLDGTVRELKLTGMKYGYVYEIAYSALDFHGKIATRKYYVTVY